MPTPTKKLAAKHGLPNPVLKTAIYTRISRDKTGEGLGVERQEDACRSLAAAKGWAVDENWLLVENDASATSDKGRPLFRRLIRGMESGEVKAVVAYRLDRLVRRLDDLSTLMLAAKENNCVIATVSGELDLTTAQGRGNAMLFGVIAAIEADTVSERILNKHQQLRAGGANAGGGKRPYGWDPTRTKQIPREVAVIRGVGARLVEGESLRAIAHDLNQRAVPTVSGGPWLRDALRDVMTRPRHAGMIVHRGQLELDPGGRPVVAKWEPIFTREEFEKIQIALQARASLGTDTRYAALRKHLLSGSLTSCGICSGPMLGAQTAAGVPIYRCVNGQHLARNRDLVDAHVLAQVVQFGLAHPVKVEHWTREQTADLSDQIEQVRDRLAALEDGFVRAGGDAAMLARMSTALQDQLVALESERVDQITFQTGEAWAQLDLSSLLSRSASLLPGSTRDKPDPAADAVKASAIEQQRAALRLYIDKVLILPTERRGRGFDESAVKIVYRDPNRLRWSGQIEAR